MSSFTISPASTAADLTDIRSLFQAYATWLDIDLTFQDFATELKHLPGKYVSSEGGILLLARDDETGLALGCVALRALEHGRRCEMKRLYVSPQGRGRGIGKALTETVIRDARARGYSAVRLDTLPCMLSARKLYEGLGFERIEAYYDTPIPGTLFFELDLSKE